MKFVVSLIPRRGESLMQRWIRRAKTKELVLIPVATALIFFTIAFCIIAPPTAVALWWVSR